MSFSYNNSDINSTSSIDYNKIADNPLSVLRTLSNEHLDRQQQQQQQDQSRHHCQGNGEHPNQEEQQKQQRKRLFFFDNNSKRKTMGNQNAKNNQDLEASSSSYACTDTFEDHNNNNKRENNQKQNNKFQISYTKRSSSSSNNNKSKIPFLGTTKNGKPSYPSSSQSSSMDVDEYVYNHDAQEYYSLEELVDKQIYVTRQQTAYFAIAFSILQTIVLAAMMIECSVAPLNINPMIGPYPDALDYWGAKNAYKILTDNEWWRYATPLLLHGGIIHLVCNVAVQLDIGKFFEKEWGSTIWFIIYLTSGVGSSIFSCIYNSNNISVGSSGAVMGLFGGKLAEILCRACESRKTKDARISYEVRQEQLTQSVCSVILVLAFSFVPFVDWAAHLGGVICGFLAGISCFAPWIKTKHCAVLWFLVGAALNLAFYVGTVTYLYTSVEPIDDLQDICKYYQQYFEDYECNCQIE